MSLCGKMKPLLSGLLLLSVCILPSQSVSPDPHVLTQSPDVSVVEGDTVNISCCWKKENSPSLEKARINWLKNGKWIKNETYHTVNNESKICWNLTVSNIRTEDSGRYVCNGTVEIPVYKELTGSGTVITVTHTEIRDNTTGGAGVSDDPQVDVLTHILRCLPVLALFITFCYFHSSRSEAQPHTPDAPENKPTSEEEEHEERPEGASENENREEEHNSTLSDS